MLYVESKLNVKTNKPILGSFLLLHQVRYVVLCFVYKLYFHSHCHIPHVLFTSSRRHNHRCSAEWAFSTCFPGSPSCFYAPPPLLSCWNHLHLKRLIYSALFLTHTHVLFFLVTLGTVCIWKDAHSEASVIMRTSNKGWSLGLKENGFHKLIIWILALPLVEPFGRSPRRVALLERGWRGHLGFKIFMPFPVFSPCLPLNATRCELVAALLSTILDSNLWNYEPR